MALTLLGDSNWRGFQALSTSILARSGKPWLLRRRQLQPYRCSDAELAFNEDASSNLLYETFDRWKPDAAEPVALGGEEGVESSGDRIRLHSEAAIGDAKLDPLPGAQQDRLS